MQPSAHMCRAEEARQRAVSIDAPLANVRQIAVQAAAAWAKEALAAERREARAAASVAQNPEFAKVLPLLLRPDERMVSENPDRGLADA